MVIVCQFLYHSLLRGPCIRGQPPGSSWHVTLGTSSSPGFDCVRNYARDRPDRVNSRIRAISGLPNWADERLACVLNSSEQSSSDVAVHNP